MMEDTMTKAIAIYTGGIQSQMQVAVRDDGTMFWRGQNKTRFGYSWSPWTATGEVLGDNARRGVILSAVKRNDAMISPGW
jgi:hypothetical protein